MKNVRRLRAMGSLCRQQAAYNPAQKWKLLAEAEYWEHLAEVEMSSYFEECNTTGSDGFVRPNIPSNSNSTGWNAASSASGR